MEVIISATILLPMVLLLFIPTTASSVQTKGPRERLLAARSIRCQMTAGTETEWNSDKPKVSEKTWEFGTVTYDSIKHQAGTDAGTARMINSIAARDVQVKVTGAGITFMDDYLNGGLDITTVFANYDSLNRFIAVASRHLVRGLNGPPSPEQYHGTCTILQ